jgi:methyltransferase (TIGR00027 family)
MDDIKIDIKGVSETLFFILYSRAIESQSKDPIIQDQKSVEIVKILDRFLSESDSKTLKKLYTRSLSKYYVVLKALRTKKFDCYVKDFLSKNPKGVIVNMGCGLDTRFHRINIGNGEFYDVDLPEVISLKKKFLKENDRYHFISSSLHDFSWMDVLSKYKDGSFLFLAEGVFQYFYENEVKSLLFELQKKFPGCEVAFDVTSTFTKRKQNNRLFNAYFKFMTGLDQTVNIKFGIKKSQEISSWNDSIELLDEWNFFDKEIDKLKFFKLYKFLESVRKSDWIIHYKLN